MAITVTICLVSQFSVVKVSDANDKAAVVSALDVIFITTLLAIGAMVSLTVKSPVSPSVRASSFVDRRKPDSISVKSIDRSLLTALPTLVAASFVKAPSTKVTVKLLTLLALAWLSAVPVKLRVITLLLVRTKLAVRPAGRLAADTLSPLTTSAV